MPAAARVQAETFFEPDEWKALSARSSWKGIAVVAHCWLVIGAAMAVGIAWPLSIPLMVMIIGNRQLGLFILMHDAAHGLLHANRAVNDRLALWFCGHELNIYRPYHLQHHRFVQQSEDPDLVLSAPFPITPESLRRKIIRDLTGQTFFAWAD
jgi:fatty acid desaturase